MELEYLRKGIYVYIDPRCFVTEKTYGFVDNMMKLMGTVQMVSCISKEGIEIKGYSWSPEDLSLPPDLKKIKPIKKQTPVLFNPKELVL